jgi:6-pyruvoyltetrahydropterin/6-carboxytetrahydropterin synthase
VRAPEVQWTRCYAFSAAHMLHSDLLTAEENRDTFGMCNNPHGHGHNYRLEVTVRGEVGRESGQVVDVRRVDGVVRREILESFHLRSLNADVHEFATLVPTSENVAVVVERRLRRVWMAEFPGGPVLEKIRIHETRRNVFEVSARATGQEGQSAGEH